MGGPEEQQRICVEVKEPCRGIKIMKTSSLVLAHKKITMNRKVPKKGPDVPIKDFGMITEDRGGEET